MNSIVLVAIVLCVLRWVPRASALFSWIPVRLQWLPTAVVAFAGVIAGRLGLAPELLATIIPPQWLATVDALLEATMGLILAAQQGMHPVPLVAAPSLSAPFDGAQEAKRRLPTLLFLGLLLSGCSGTFEEARVTSPRATAPRSATLSQRCHQLDDRRQLWGGVAKGAAVVAGGAGLATIPTDSKGARIGLAAGGVGAAAVAAGAVYVAELAGQSWAEECAL